MTDRWFESRYTGLFTRFGAVRPRPYDPAVSVWAGAIPPWGPRDRELGVGGAGWDAESAEAACVGEALERWQPYPLPRDQAVEASFDAWPLDEPAVRPGRWVLFHPGQYAQPDFPFVPFTGQTVYRWVCFRHVLTGRPEWVPEELAFLYLRPGARHALCPSVSTGLSCGRWGQPVLLRGLQEVIERDAVVGAWWGTYPLEEWPADEVLGRLGAEVARRLRRPNLTYRCYRVVSPFSAHAVLVTVEGEDREGYCFSAGSACRETRVAAWDKALLEAVHGRHYVRFLRQSPPRPPVDPPADFPDHAVYYSLHPERLRETVLRMGCRSPCSEGEGEREEVPALADRLGTERPMLFRNLTPPALGRDHGEWYVLRVLVPGLQPLHGNHRWAHLGGRLWGRRLKEYEAVRPHPFP